jgi:hypothetical protein
MYKKFLVFFILPLFLFLFIGNNLKVSAFNLFDRSCNGAKVQGGNGGDSPICDSNDNAKSDDGHDNVVLRTINEVASIVASVAGFAAVLMIVVAGFSYVTAGGNAEDTKKARSRIIYASVGLIIIALAWTIVRFVLDRLLS